MLLSLHIKVKNISYIKGETVVIKEEDVEFEF
jgi:hypothetical protein